MTKLAELEQRLVRVEQALTEMQSLMRTPASENPWVQMQGTLPDDELTDEWQEAMEAYRREQDDEANRP